MFYEVEYQIKVGDEVIANSTSEVFVRDVKDIDEQLQNTVAALVDDPRAVVGEVTSVQQATPV